MIVNYQKIQYRLTAADCKEYNVEYYNLATIILVYMSNSYIAI